MNQIRIAVAGLNFGSAFLPYYKAHPGVESVAIVDTNEEWLNEVGDKYGVTERYRDLAPVLESESFHAVHLVTPIPQHARESVAVLESGKHCACAVPMGLSLADLRAVIEAQRRSGKRYMMMETAVYSHEFLYARDMLESGEIGNIQFLRGAHYQDMEGWPDYWMGLPPMHYATHAVAPLLALAGRRAGEVHCYGSGTMRKELQKAYSNPWPVETAIFRIADTPLAAEVTRSLFETAREYAESFSVYGSKAGFEWQQLGGENPVVFRLGGMSTYRGLELHKERVQIPHYADRLRKAVAEFAGWDEGDERLDAYKGGGHGGSHPRLVHEFVSAIVEERDPWIHAERAADWTAAGICAHESAMAGGKTVEIPHFT